MIQETIEFVGNNWDTIAIAALSIYGAANAIAKLTPTQKDDKFLEKVRKVFVFVAEIVPDLKVKRNKITK